MSLKILKFPNPILKQVAEPVDLSNGVSDKIKDLILEMKRTIEVYDAAGLAAPQVGESLRVIVCKLTCGEVTMINPQINLVDVTTLAVDLDGSGKIYEMSKEITEGCLSLPGISSPVSRYRYINVSYFDETGKKCDGFFGNKDSVIIQHEVDHLNGVVFIDKLGSARSMMLQKYFKKAR